MILKYIGKKPLPYVLQTPIPFLSKSYREGEIAFTPEAEVRDDWAEYLLEECTGAFERVGGTPVPDAQAPHVLCQKEVEELLKYVGKRFSGKAGKWNAIAFIRRHHAETVLGLRKLQIVDRVIHWELVPLALADVRSDDLPPVWNKGTKGLMKNAGKRNLRSRDAITDRTVGVVEEPVPA